jgi:hypothetical protein
VQRWQTQVMAWKVGQGNKRTMPNFAELIWEAGVQAKIVYNARIKPIDTQVGTTRWDLAGYHMAYRLGLIRAVR